MKIPAGIILAVITAAAIQFACGPKEAPVKNPAFDFRVQNVFGDVKIITSSGEKPAAQGDMLGINDTVTTGSRSIAHITYGSSGIIRISANSRVSVSSIAGGTASDTLLRLVRGKIFLTLGKLRNTGFRVKTPTVVASVRGTSFVISADLVKGARLSVMKGKVSVVPVSMGEAVQGKVIQVNAGQKTDYISEKTVESVLTGSGEIALSVMTEAEIIEIKNETLDIKVDEIRGLDQDIKTEVKRDVIQVDPKILRKQASDASGGQITRSPVKVQDDSRLKKRIEEEKLAEENRKLEEEKRRQEEELLRQAEEQRKAEQIRKERASNIPVL